MDEIQEIPVLSMGRSYFQSQDEKKYITCGHDDKPFCYPFHSVCLEIAKRVIKYKKGRSNRPESRATSLRELFDIHRLRYRDQPFNYKSSHNHPRYPPLNWFWSPISIMK